MFFVTSGIPIYIHPFFWMFAALIGWLMGGNLISVFVWIFIIFVSVIVHELGHAFMALAFKQKPKIELMALGGATSYEGKNLKFWQQFLIVLNGPLFGFLLFGLASFILYLNIFTAPFIVSIIKTVQFVNLFWTILNLLPIIPLDGGQLLRILLEAAFGLKGFRASLFIGMMLSGILSLMFFGFRNFIMGPLFFLFAFQGLEMYRKSKYLSLSDRSEENSKEMRQAEILLAEGKKDEAKKLFADIRGKAQGGLLYVAATHYLALLEYQSGNNHGAYELLLSIRDKLADEAFCLLHKLAFEEENYQLVSELSSLCFKIMPSQEVALNNARAFGKLNQPTFAGGWLKTASDYGNLNFEEILREQFFEKVKEDPHFQKFIK